MGKGRGLQGAEKRGRDTEKRIGQGKEKRERTGYWWGEERGENFKEGEEGSSKRKQSVKLQGEEKKEQKYLQ